MAKRSKSGSELRWVQMGEGCVGQGEKLFTYSYQSLADLFGVTVDTIRQWVRRGKFDPNSIRSIAEHYTEKTRGLRELSEAEDKTTQLLDQADEAAERSLPESCQTCPLREPRRLDAWPKTLDQAELAGPPGCLDCGSPVQWSPADGCWYMYCSRCQHS